MWSFTVNVELLPVFFLSFLYQKLSEDVSVFLSYFRFQTWGVFKRSLS